MATNIVKEDNLLKVNHHSTTLIYDAVRKDDLLSKTDLNLVVVFKDKDGEYPNGKIVVSDEFVTKYTYEYVKDDNDNVISCTINKTHSKNGQSTIYEKTSTITYYDKNGRIVKREHYTGDGIMFNREQFWYWETGKLKTKKVKSSDVIETTEYNQDGKPVLIWAKTIRSGNICRTYTANYNANGELVHYTKNAENYECTIVRDRDHNGNLLSETEIFKHLNTKRVFAKNVKVYDPNADFKISAIFKNGYEVKRYVYDLDANVIKIIESEKDIKITTDITRTLDTETGEKTVEKHIYTYNSKCNRCFTKYIKEVYDENNNLLLFAEDNSKVTTYTYTEDNKRESAITKQLVDEEFIMIDKITYTYTTGDLGEEIKTRTEERYDKDGNVTYKQIHTESESDTKKEYTSEQRVYEAPSNNSQP